MIFSSIEFILYFLPVFMLAYILTPVRYRNVTLLAGSIIFYTIGEPRYVFLLLGSILINYFLGLHVAGGKKAAGSVKKRKRQLLTVAVLLNVSVLLFFKLESEKVGLPLGISFYTFQILSYLIDVYRGDVPRERSFLKLASYVTMFPQLISGPLVSYGKLSGQLGDFIGPKEGGPQNYPDIARRCNARTIQSGLMTFTVGMAFKVLLADRIGILWFDVQKTGFESITTAYAWMGAVAYSMKIYFDFYGYSLMAIGVGRMMGFELPENFHDPYLARGVRDFYRRWHMTLGDWFKKYIYIPLGGNRQGEGRTILNLLAVWILTSLWHGITGNFLAWGMILWFCIVVERQLDRCELFKEMQLLPRILVWVIIPVSWMCFAITDISQLQVYLGRMFALNQGINVSLKDWQRALSDYWYLFGACFIACTPILKKVYVRFKNTFVGKLLLSGIFWYCIWRILQEGENTFMYFRF